MPEQALTATPTPLAGLAVGTAYTVQNPGGKPARVVRAQSVPTGPEGSFVLRSNGNAGTVTRQSAADEIYVWVDSDAFGTGKIVYDEIA